MIQLAKRLRTAAATGALAVGLAATIALPASATAEAPPVTVQALSCTKGLNTANTAWARASAAAPGAS
jgi:hypothetical protein